MYSLGEKYYNKRPEVKVNERWKSDRVNRGLLYIFGRIIKLSPRYKLVRSEIKKEDDHNNHI